MKIKDGRKGKTVVRDGRRWLLIFFLRRRKKRKGKGNRYKTLRFLPIRGKKEHHLGGDGFSFSKGGTLTAKGEFTRRLKFLQFLPYAKKVSVTVC